MLRFMQFTVDAPGANKVTVAGSFNNWDAEKNPLKKDKAGTWKLKLRIPKGWYEYKFVIDGKWQEDPRCINFVCDSFGGRNCALVVE